MTFIDGMIESQAAIERERRRWAAEKAFSRLESTEDMRWILRQADDDYAAAEKFLIVWDELLPAGWSLARYSVQQMGIYRKRIVAQTRSIHHIPARLSMPEAALADLLRDRGPLIVKRMTSDPFTFRPTDKVWLATSHKPQARTDDRGIWRAARAILLPSKSYAVPVFVMHGTLDIHLAAYLMTEWS